MNKQRAMDKDTKGKQVLAHLKIHLLNGGTVTHNEALKWWRTSRLSEYIRRCRHDHGMDIKTEMCKDGMDEYAVYSLVKKPKVSRIKTREYLNQAIAKGGL